MLHRPFVHCRPVPLVALIDVAVSRAGTKVLDGIDLEIDAGEAIGVTGPNGSGKTTLLRTIATLLSPSRGTGTVLGAKLGSAAVYRIRPNIGYAGHQATLIEDLTLAENLRHYRRLTGGNETAVEDALLAVGLEGAGNLQAGRCSNGMKRRADLARLWMSDCHLLLLDEAEAGLDREAVAIVHALLERTRRRAGAAILVSHDADSLNGRTDRCFDLKRGVLH